MRNYLFPLLALAGMSLGVENAGALPIDTPTYQDIDLINKTLNGGSGSTGGRFDIRPGASDASPSVTIGTFPDAGNQYLNAGTTYNDIVGFDPAAAYDIVSAYAYFYLRNAQDLVDVFSINLTDFDYLFEFQGDGSQFIVSDEVNGLSLTFLNDNGYLDYTVTREGGDFTVDYAQLQVVALAGSGPTIPGAVPDAGSTAGMLGGALLIIGALRRRFAF
jgi:hypothetical protein